MKIVELEQGTKQWLDWRTSGIGASEIGAVCGVNAHQSAYELWCLKTGKTTFNGNYATSRGSSMEDIAREYYEEVTTTKAVPICIEDPRWPFLKASLDGWVDELGVVVEIKCPLSLEKHDAACHGKISPEYIYQMNQQMLLSGAKIAHFVSYYPDSEQPFSMSVVMPYKKIQAEIIEKGREFWRLVVDRVSPPLNEKDQMIVEDDADLESLILSLKEANNQVKAAKALKDKLQSLIIERLPHPNILCSGMSIKKSKRRGAIDYASMPGLPDDLDKYRKPDQVSYSFREVKKKPEVKLD